MSLRPPLPFATLNGANCCYCRLYTEQNMSSSKHTDSHWASDIFSCSHFPFRFFTFLLHKSSNIMLFQIFPRFPIQVYPLRIISLFMFSPCFSGLRNCQCGTFLKVVATQAPDARFQPNLQILKTWMPRTYTENKTSSNTVSGSLIDADTK